MNVTPISCNYSSINNNSIQKQNTSFKASYSKITEPLSKDIYNFGESAIDKLLKTIKTPLTKKQVKILYNINRQNKVLTQMSMDRIFQDKFQTRKEILIKELSELVPNSVIEKIKNAANSSELAAIVERFQTGMIVDAQAKVMKINTVKDLDKEVSKEWKERCQKTDAIQTAIQRALLIKTNIPEIKHMEDILLKEYGLKVSLGNDIDKANKIFEACKIWYEKGEKLPEEIIVSKCMSMYGAGGQVLNGKTVIFSENKFVDTMFKILTKIDKLDFLHLKTPTYSTNSQYHLKIHEFSHTVQPQTLRNENIELPQHLQKAAKKVSKYASVAEGLSELYAELKTKNILAKEKMKKEEIEILNFLESLK